MELGTTTGVVLILTPPHIKGFQPEFLGSAHDLLKISFGE
jgi:hypothetical protein